MTPGVGHPPPQLGDVFREHADFVWRTVRRLGAPDAMADDLVQEVFVVLHRRLGEFDGRASLRSWLYVLARGVVGNHLRRHRRERARLRRVEPPLPRPGPEEYLHARDAAAMVELFLSTLSPSKRHVFDLSDVEGMAGPEVADALGIPINTVYSRLHAARQSFRAFVREHREPPVVAPRRRSGAIS